MKPAQARRKGLAAEAAVRDYLVAHGVTAERIPPGADIDRGDLIVIDGDGDRHTVQIKNYADFNRAAREGLADLPRQMDNTGAAIGWLVAKPKGITDPAQWRVCMTLEQMLTFLGGTR